MSWKLSASPVARNPFTFAPFAHFRISIRFLLFFFFVSTRMKGEAETRASCRCFRLVSGCSILKKFWNASSRNYARIFFTNFPIPLIFNANSNCFQRDFTWLCLVLSDWFRFIDYRWVYPLSPLSRRRWYTHSREIDGESK